MLTRKDRQLRALARVLAAQPDISYLALADRAGISRRTLYRIGSSRELLLDTLYAAASAAVRATLARTDIASSEPITALRRLTADFVADDDLYVYWVAQAKIPGTTDYATEIADDVALYHAAMHDVIAGGQRAGLFRHDIPLAWIQRSYDALLFAASEARRSGEAEADSLVELILATLLDGIAVVPPDVAIAAPDSTTPRRRANYARPRPRSRSRLR